MNNYYVVLTGAIKNAGDFLITEKCKELLRYERPGYDLVQLNRWESVDEHLDIINKSKALILLGGPAVTHDLYPNIYKLTDNLDDINVPIVPMAVGWNTKRGDFQDMLTFTFSSKSKELLTRFASNGVGISVRDSYAAQILLSQGIENIYLTGCASWYTPEKFDKELIIDKVQSVAFTPAQDPKYSELSKNMMDLIKKEYPNQKLVCAFHRGIGVIDDYTSVEDARNTAELSKYAEELGFEVVDLAYSFDNYQIYDAIDMHIGFRVHGHLYFLSNRKPSLLIHEDGRGVAMSEAIGLSGVDAFQSTILKKPSTAVNLISKKTGSSKRVYPEVRTQALEELHHLITMHKLNNYRFMNGVFKNFDVNYQVMREFIQALPV